MQLSQTFDILRRAGGIRAARIITAEHPDMSALRTHIIAWKLRRGVPVAKIIHKKWFYGLDFYTNRHTLDPRPDTETLAACVIDDAAGTNPRILDLGTGTGCVAISILKNIPASTALAIDISRRAIRVAQRNINRHGLTERMRVRRGDFTRGGMTHERFDIIVSNPPYIARGDNRVDAGAMHDPAMALYAKKDGYAAYEHIAKNGLRWIKPHGNVYLEIGAGMATRIKKIFIDAGWEFLGTKDDLAGITRVIIFRAPNI